MDSNDFESWYRQSHPRLSNSIYVICGSIEIAREATDEAFARALANWARVHAMDSPEGWTFKVALNLVRRETRRRSRTAAAHANVRGPEAFEVELADADLWAAVRALPDRQRQTIVLRFVADLAEADIAKTLRVSRGTVASNLSRALSTLNARLVDKE